MGERVRLLVVVLAFGCALSCAGRVVERAAGQPAAQRKVLIASHDTEFKNAVAEGLMAALAEEPFSSKLVDVADLAQEDAASFDVVVILDRVHGGHISGQAAEFLAGLPDKGKVVLLATAGNADWRLGDPAVDAVTAASRPTGVSAAVQALEARVRQRLEQGRRR